jgi:hypothetical protein
METLLQILLQCMGLVLPENVVNTDAYLDDEIIKTWGEEGKKRPEEENRTIQGGKWMSKKRGNTRKKGDRKKKLHDVLACLA